MAVRLTIEKFSKGWEQFAAATDPKRFRKALAINMRGATETNLKMVMKKIGDAIDSHKFEDNAGLTILFKNASLPLVGGNKGIGAEVGGGWDPGGWMRSKLKFGLEDAFGGVVGVLRNRKGVNIAFIVHEGAALRMTEKRARWLAMAIKSAMKKQGKNYSREGQAFAVSGGKATKVAGASSIASSRSFGHGGVIVIPARPFIRQVMENPGLQKKIIDNWVLAVATSLKVK